MPEEMDSATVLTGWRFAAASCNAFAMPLAFAVAGSLWFRGNQASQLAGAVVGLCLGTTIAAFAARLLHPPGSAEVKQ